MTIPKEIPCACCDAVVRVVVREAAAGKIKYVGAKCTGCGLYIDTAGHSFESPEEATTHALGELRLAWARAKATIHEIIIQNGCEPARAVEIYKKQNSITVAPQRTRRKG